VIETVPAAFQAEMVGLAEQRLGEMLSTFRQVLVLCLDTEENRHPFLLSRYGMPQRSAESGRWT